ncbi:hypothetical protein AB1E19_003824 [Capra hircus]
MKVKEESEKVGLKFNIQKTKIMASGPVTSWQIDGETVETVSDFILGGSKITADGDCSHEIKRHLCQVNMAGRPAVSASSKWLEGIRKWYYNAAGFNKLGLMRDDTIHENDDVKEAIRRLPENLYNDRVFCIKRALDLSMRQQILPKEQWTKYEEDKFYLEPYLKEVIRERKEREEWAKK